MRSADEDLCVSLGSIAAKGIAGNGLGVQRTEPLAVPPHLGRRVGRVHDDRLAADREFLMDLVADDCDVIGQLLETNSRPRKTPTRSPGCR